MDWFKLTLHSPITDEEWYMLTDIDFSITDTFMFHAKNGKEVRFVKDRHEIIRCKDCKWWYEDADSVMCCDYTDMSQPEDGFCNRAEQREGDADAD